MTERVRFLKGGVKVEGSSKPEFINPFSYESSPDARVQLELEYRHIPFSYRYFDGDAPSVKRLIPEFQPEFTLREYKIVIIINGSYYGTLPGVLDQAALADVLLKKDGWKCVIWYETELTTQGASALFERDLPELHKPVITGPEHVNGFGHPLTMVTRRQYLRGLGLLRKLFGKETEGAATNVANRKRDRVFVGATDNGRRRPLRNRYRKGAE